MRFVLTMLPVIVPLALALTGKPATSGAQVASPTATPITCDYKPWTPPPTNATPVAGGDCENWKPTYRRYVPIVAR